MEYYTENEQTTIIWMTHKCLSKRTQILSQKKNLLCESIYINFKNRQNYSMTSKKPEK